LKLNVAFGTSGVGATASVTGGNELQVTGSAYGAKAKLTITFELGGIAAAQQLGFNTTAYEGVNVAGTINGMAATGSGRVLVAKAPALGTNAAEGLNVLYTGTSPGTADVTYTLGLGGMMFNRAAPMVQDGDGLISAKEDAIQTAIDNATRRADAAQRRLDKMRETLVKRFTAMETALSRLQAQSSALVNQLNALQSQSK